MLSPLVIENTNLNEANGNQGLLLEKSDDGAISIRTADGVELNTFLPDGCTFELATTKYVPYGFNGRTVVVPEDIEADGLMGKLSLAHEIGHARHQAYTELQMAIKTKMKLIEVLEKEDVVDYIKACLDIYMLDIELEQQGWQKGQPVAVAIGIDEDVYGEYAQANLRTYYYRDLEDLYNRLPAEAPLYDDSIELYDPESEEIKSFQYKDLLSWLASMELTTKVEAAYATLDELDEKLSA